MVVQPPVAPVGGLLRDEVGLGVNGGFFLEVLLEDMADQVRQGELGIDGPVFGAPDQVGVEIDVETAASPHQSLPSKNLACRCRLFVPGSGQTPSRRPVRCRRNIAQVTTQQTV